ncbi:hypothetical protein SRABI128_00546 [Microbacterium sp. Bi128]|nr:hypothetical protein SRABI128_00546 [Microbacterium sp. Bi128]
MPTASPSITASSGVVEETVAKPVAMKMSATESATPRIAVASGIPATKSDRNVSMRTIAAMTTPSASVMLGAGSSVAKSWPPSTVCDPEGRSVPSVALSSRRPSSVAVGTAVDSPENWMRMIAARPLSDTPPETRSSKGFVTASTKSSFWMSETVVPMAS